MRDGIRRGFPRQGEPVIRGRAYRHRPGAYAVLLRGGEVLLTVQDGTEPEIQLPGGGIDPGESPLAALHREVLEETGWHVAGARRIGGWRRFKFMPDYGIWAEKVYHVFLARPTLRLGPPLEPAHEALWVPLGAAAALVTGRAEAALLARLARGRS